jgi:Zn-finger nucleic acid-binding protein
MNAATLHCPSCGAAAASDATQCRYCGSRLATVACPKCFGMVFVGSEFCPHCGAKVPAMGMIDGAKVGPCPRCWTPLRTRRLGDTSLAACDQCGGVWIDAFTFEELCAERERENAILAMNLPPPLVPQSPDMRRAYVKCPVCAQLMNRVNFAHCSGILIDVCSQHGIWLDAEEIRGIFSFIKGGGMERSRAVEQQVHMFTLGSAGVSGSRGIIDSGPAISGWFEDDKHGLTDVVDIISEGLRFFFK